MVGSKYVRNHLAWTSWSQVIYVLFAAEDIEAGTRKMKIQAEPTLPIYLKVNLSSKCRQSKKLKKAFWIFVLSSKACITVCQTPIFISLNAYGLIGYYVFGQARMEVYVEINATLWTWKIFDVRFSLVQNLISCGIFVQDFPF